MRQGIEKGIFDREQPGRGVSDSELRIEVGKMVRAIRLKNGLSRALVASWLGVLPGTVTRIELGIGDLSAMQWFNLCEKTGTLPDEISKYILV